LIDPRPAPTADPGSTPTAYYRREIPLVGVLAHPYYRTHETGDHPENRFKVDRVMDAIDAAPWSDRVMRFFPRFATAEQIALAHDPKFVDLVRASAATGGGWMDTDTRLGPGSYETALLAAGGVVAAVDDVMMEAFHRPDGVFCVVRPPGHHATADRTMGFCLFNNVAVAARYAQQTYGLERVMILDWDVHHGNGTNDIFHADPSVLFVSLHQWPLYPGSGWTTDVGRGPGEGFTVNVPLPPGVGDPAYRAAFERIVEPIAEQFAPQLVLVSAGQDCHAADPLSDLLVTLDGFRFMERAVRRIADRHARGRHVLALEGGYNQHTLPWLVAGIVAAMGDLPDDTVDPFAPPDTTTRPPAHDERLRDVAAALAPYWKL
jgi:acetoin utilization deacetylase AcuC-like enzyme